MTQTKADGPEEIVAYLIDQIDSAATYYGEARQNARRQLRTYMGFVQIAYIAAALLFALSFAGSGLSRVGLPFELDRWLTAESPLRLSATWAFALLAMGYAVSSYAQRRGFLNAWSRYAITEQTLLGLKRSIIVEAHLARQATPVDLAPVVTSGVARLNQIVLAETGQWAATFAADLDRVHDLLAPVAAGGRREDTAKPVQPN